MELSLRLAAVAGMVPPCRSLADIGTDHAYLPLFLTENGRVSRAYACDVRPGPLARAARNIAAAGLSGQIVTVLSDGLEALPEPVDTLVVAGMGGRLMKSLLSSQEGSAVAVREAVRDLILQPQSELSELYAALPGLGFLVCEEAAVWDRGKCYFVFHAVPLGSSEAEPFESFGRRLALRRDPAYLAYLEKELAKREKLLETLRKKENRQTSDAVSERIGALLEEKTQLLNDLSCYEKA